VAEKINALSCFQRGSQDVVGTRLIKQGGSCNDDDWAHSEQT
jgi:hypothetical protein